MHRKINIGFVVLISTVAALGGLMFGFDIAIITGANPFIELYFGLSKIELGLGTSSLLFGCIAVMAIAQLVFALKYVPETKGKTLEEIEIMWQNINYC